MPLHTPESKFDLRRIVFVGSLLVIGVIFVGYLPSIKVGFLGDDWWFLGKAASLNLPDYLTFYFDPRVQIFWYRPLYGILLWFEHLFFGSSPDGYHLGQIALHAINCLLLFAVVRQLSRQWRLGFLAALFYALLPVNNLAVFWIAVQDPLAMVFYLASIWFWVVYLENQRRTFYALAFVAFTLALLGKEATVFLPVTLFLVDRLLVAKPVSVRDLIRRYTPWGVALLAYLLIEYRVQTVAYFPNRWGYSIGWHVVENLVHYFALTIFPWAEDGLIVYIAFAIVAIALIFIGWRKRSKLLLFLLLQTLLTIAPAVGFPIQFFQARYLYFASTVTAVLFAIALDTARERLPQEKWMIATVSAAAMMIIFANSAVTTAATGTQVEAGRQMRVPLRDIYQQHPTYPANTYLYFIEPPYPMIMRNLTGMFLLRYGTNVRVWSNNAEWGGVDEDRFANLREYKNSFVYYFDATGQRHEIPVDLAARATASPLTPANFQSNIQLEGFEVTSTTIKEGGDLVLLLYWQSTGQIDKDYTVFVHMIDEKGAAVLGEDTQPRGGQAPTTNWKIGKMVADAHVLKIADDFPPGIHRLEVGLYYLPTLERLAVVDGNAHPVSDKLVIESFQVVEPTSK